MSGCTSSRKQINPYRELTEAIAKPDEDTTQKAYICWNGKDMHAIYLAKGDSFESRLSVLKVLGHYIESPSLPLIGIGSDKLLEGSLHVLYSVSGYKRFLEMESAGCQLPRHSRLR